MAGDYHNCSAEKYFCGNLPDGGQRPMQRYAAAAAAPSSHSAALGLPPLPHMDHPTQHTSAYASHPQPRCLQYSPLSQYTIAYPIITPRQTKRSLDQYSSAFGSALNSQYLTNPSSALKGVAEYTP